MTPIPEPRPSVIMYAVVHKDVGAVLAVFPNRAVAREWMVTDPHVLDYWSLRIVRARVTVFT